MAEIPMIAYWDGVPLNEVPRDELEREFCAAHEKIRRLEREICDRSVAHIRDLAESGRRELEHQKHWLLKWMGVS